MFLPTPHHRSSSRILPSPIALLEVHSVLVYPLPLSVYLPIQGAYSAQTEWSLSSPPPTSQSLLLWSDSLPPDKAGASYHCPITQSHRVVQEERGRRVLVVSDVPYLLLTSCPTIPRRNYALLPWQRDETPRLSSPR